MGFELGDGSVFGRPLKVDRQEAMAVVVALQEWFAMDHEARIARDQDRIDRIAAAIEGVPGVSTSVVPDRFFGAPGLQVRLDASARYTAEGLATALREGRPSISVNWEDNSLSLVAGPLAEGEEEIVARRLRELLTD
jgi:L-seryl-tRNA(Ser) seleniumtransferase